jgi:hypothetical protein
MTMRMMGHQGRQFSPLFVLLAVLLLQVHDGSFCEAFLMNNNNHQPPVSRLTYAFAFRIRCSHHKLYSNSNNEEEEGSDQANAALQKDRLRLEALIMGTTGANDAVKKKKQSASASSVDWKDQLVLSSISKNPPLLTAMARERFETEIQLLKSLKDSNDGLSELWTLWHYSRGPAAANILEEADSLTAQGPASWQRAEDQLQQLLVDEQEEEGGGVLFVEAVNRLATLYFLQGRYPESKQMCEVVLAAKPWHFGALSGIAMVCKGLEDSEGMMEWAQKWMPPLQADDDDNRSRKEWVDDMVAQAQTKLEEAEERVKASFQELPLRDEPTSVPFQMDQQQQQQEDLDNDAWQ